jgi:hypothetical protein
MVVAVKGSITFPTKARLAAIKRENSERLSTAKDSGQRKAQYPELWNGMGPSSHPAIRGDGPSLVFLHQEQRKGAISAKASTAASVMPSA